MLIFSDLSLLADLSLLSNWLFSLLSVPGSVQDLRSLPGQLAPFIYDVLGRRRHVSSIDKDDVGARIGAPVLEAGIWANVYRHD